MEQMLGWGNQSPGSGPEMYLSWSACRLSHSHALGVGSPASLQLQSWLYCAAQVRYSIPPPRVLLMMRDTASSLTLITLGPAPLPTIDGIEPGREGRHLSLICATVQQTRAMAILPAIMPLGPAHLQPSDLGPGLLCCPGEGQGSLSQGLHQVRGRAGSPALMTPGPSLPPALGGKG